MASNGCGEYQLLQQLGDGGMGRVLRAGKDASGLQFAVKVARPGFEARLAREFHALRQFDHPNIIGVCPRQPSRCEAPPIGKFCVELLGGGSCHDRGQCSSWRDALVVTRDVAAALQHIHERRWIHRDVKPGNVMLSEDGCTKLIDFGLARPLGGGERTAAETQTGVGTPAYMAPEQFFENPTRHTTAVDTFALGCLLFYSIVGRAPFRDPLEGQWKISTLGEVLEDRPTPLQSGCDQLIRDCTHSRPSRRCSPAAVTRQIQFLIDQHGEALDSSIPAPRSRTKTRLSERRDVVIEKTRSVPEFLERLPGDVSVVEDGRVFRVGEGLYLVLENGLAGDRPLQLKTFPELEAVPPTRHSWVQRAPTGSFLLFSDHVLRRLEANGDVAQERVFPRSNACELKLPSLTTFESASGRSRRQVGCRARQVNQLVVSGVQVPRACVEIEFFSIGLDSTGDFENRLVTVYLAQE